MSDKEIGFHDDEDETGDTGPTAPSSTDDDTEGHMHPEEFPQGPARPNNDTHLGNTPQS